MPIALALTLEERPAKRSGRAVLPGLSTQTTPATPRWAIAHVKVETLVAAGIKLDALRDALAAFTPEQEDDRMGVVDWVTPDEESTLAIEVLLPLMVLARDLRQLGEVIDEVVLDGA